MDITNILSSKKKTFEDAKRDLFKRLSDYDIIELENNVVEVNGCRYKISQYLGYEIVAYTRIKDAFGDYEKQPITSKYIMCSLTQIK